MKYKLISFILIIIFILPSVSAFAEVIENDFAFYVYTDSSNDVVISDTYAIANPIVDPDYVFINGRFSWEIQEGDRLYLDFYTYDGDTVVDTITINPSSLSERNVLYNLDYMGFKLRMETSSIPGERYFWCNSWTNSQGKIVYYLDPAGIPDDPPGGDPGEDPDPPCEFPSEMDVNIIGVEIPIPIYFPDPPPPPKAPSINPLPSPGNYIADADDFDMEPNIPNYDPRHYDPSRDGDIFRYEPPPLDIPDPIESPGPLPSIPDPIIIPHDNPMNKDEPKTIDNPIVSENPMNPENPFIPEQPKEMDPVKIEPPRELDPVNVEPPREMTGYEPEPPREIIGYTPEPPRQMTGYEPESPYTPDPPKNMDPPIDKR